MKFHAFSSLAMIVLCSCSSPSPPQTESSNASITGGAEENGRTEVGVLFVHNADGSVATDCTGTLVRTAQFDTLSVVLTAKHCEGMDSFYLGSGSAQDFNDGDWEKA